jgi:hypothetical protein
LNLADALAKSLGEEAPGPGPGPGPTPGGTLSEQVAALLSQALEHFQKANDALAAGDLGTYQVEIQKAQSLIQRANDLATSKGGPSPSPSPSGSPSPSPSG